MINLPIASVGAHFISSFVIFFSSFVPSSFSHSLLPPLHLVFYNFFFPLLFLLVSLALLAPLDLSTIGPYYQALYNAFLNFIFLSFLLLTPPPLASYAMPP